MVTLSHHMLSWHPNHLGNAFCVLRKKSLGQCCRAEQIVDKIHKYYYSIDFPKERLSYKLECVGRPNQ
jgi:hypothetical protein